MILINLHVTGNFDVAFSKKIMKSEAILFPGTVIYSGFGRWFRFIAWKNNTNSCHETRCMPCHRNFSDSVHTQYHEMIRVVHTLMRWKTRLAEGKEDVCNINTVLYEWMSQRHRESEWNCNNSTTFLRFNKREMISCHANDELNLLEACRV